MLEAMSDERRVVRGGRVFDGTGAPARTVDVVIEQGAIAGFVAPGAPIDARELDAREAWVMPGFLDLHTHYDAEVELLPGLPESVRHGITTVVMGSCGLSMAVGDPVDLADMFCRVEGIPRSTVKPLLERVKTWRGPSDYFDHLRTLPLGPNVASLLGHSAIRAHAMGLARSLTPARPTEDELCTMESLLREALDAGYLGLSINTLTWDKMDGDGELRSRPTPSVYARWSEYRRLARMLRARGRILQGVPNVSTKVNVLLFFLESIGLGRPGLKTMLITMMDAKAARLPFRLAGTLARLVNGYLGADLRFQSLPNVFDLWVDGLEAPIFEEIGAGTAALHVRDEAERSALLRDPAYRRRFKREWSSFLLGRAYHRDLSDTEIQHCPGDPSLVGRSIGDVARERGQDPVDTLLDLVAEHGNALRWYTVIGNDRPEWLRWIVQHPAVLVGFSDAGAHLRNMAHYNFPLRLLRMARAENVMPIERAVHRLTGELADWLGLEAGRLRAGARADLVIVDPAGLTDELDRIVEVEMPGFDGLTRLVRRNDRAIRSVLVGGREVVRHGAPTATLGLERTGTVLAAC